MPQDSSSAPSGGSTGGPTGVSTGGSTGVSTGVSTSVSSAPAVGEQPAGPAQTLSGGVGPGASLTKLEAEKKAVVDIANDLVQQSSKAFEKLKRDFYKKSHNGQTLADDMMKNFLLCKDLFDMFWSQRLKSKHEELQRLANNLNPKDPVSFVQNIGDVSKRVYDAQAEYKKIQEQQNLTQHGTFTQRAANTINQLTGTSPEVEQRQNARQEVNREPSSGPRR